MPSTIQLNGEPRELAMPGVPDSSAAKATVAEVLTHFGYTVGSVAVARNGEFVPRGAYTTTPVLPGDAIEVVAPMQGG